MDIVEYEDSKAVYCEKWHHFERPAILKRAIDLNPIPDYLRYMCIDMIRFNQSNAQWSTSYYTTFIESRSVLFSEIDQIQ